MILFTDFRKHVVAVGVELLLSHFMPLFVRYTLKTSENQRFSYVFRGYKKRPVV